MKIRKLTLWKLLILEVIIISIVASLGYIFAKEKDGVDIGLDQWSSAYTTIDTGVWSMSEDKMTNGPAPSDYDLSSFRYLTDGEIVAFSSPTVTLPKGDYTLLLNYSSNVATFAGIEVDERSEPYITTGRMYMAANSAGLVYHITAKEDIKSFRVDVHYNGEGVIHLTNASIIPNANGVKRGLFILLVLSLLIDLCFVKRKWFATHQTRVLMMTVAVILASLPLAAPEIIYGHDIMFHLNRIEGISRALTEHQFPVRMYPEWMNNYGYPTPVYYGDFLLYLPAVMRIMGFTLMASYKTYIVFVNILTVIIAYVCFRRIFRDYKIAVVSACAYLLATYRLMDIYCRAAVGEYSAMLFLPVIAMAMYRIYTDEESAWKQYRYNALYLALGMTGLLCTHILSTEMTVVALIIVALMLAPKTFTVRRLRAIGASITGTLVFGAWYIVPFVYHFLFVPTRLNSGNVTKVFAAEGELSTIDGLSNYFPPVQANGAYLGQLFDVFGNPFGFGSADVSERYGATPGLVLMGALLVAIFYWCKKRANKDMKVLTVLSVLFLWMSTNLFPWDFLGLKVSRLFTTIEIPSRFLSLADLTLSLLVGATLLQIKRTKNLPQVFGDPEEDGQWEEMMKRLHSRRFRNVLIAVMVGCVFTSLLFLRDAIDNDFTVNRNDAAELDTVKGNAFVCLRDGSEVWFPCDLTVGEAIVRYDLASNDGSTIVANVETSGASFVEIPKLRYPGYVAKDDSGNVLKTKDGTNNVIRVEIPAAYNGTVTVTWKEPISWRIGELITLLGFVFYLLVWWRRPSTYKSFK